LGQVLLAGAVLFEIAAAAGAALVAPINGLPLLADALIMAPVHLNIGRHQRLNCSVSAGYVHAAKAHVIWHEPVMTPKISVKLPCSLTSVTVQKQEQISLAAVGPPSGDS
jgi:hypothetical protein